MRRWLLAGLIAAAGAVALAQAPAAGAAVGAGGAVSREDAIDQLRTTSVSIDRTLALIKAGKRTRRSRTPRPATSSTSSSSRSRCGSRTRRSRSSAETKFAEIRALISDGAPTSEIRSKIVELRGLIDDAERQLTDPRARRAGGRLRPVVPHHLPRGPRGRAAALGAARLPRGGQGTPVPAPHPLRRGGRGGGDRRHASSLLDALLLGCCRSAARCSRRSPRSSPSRCCSTSRSG